mmetsp:Transcript_19635/g.32184  ORF Transcript_19635/g.32184 Transcript_19635/m.32184 type:complete len:265 (-) Transcript_19635:24-818(-)
MAEQLPALPPKKKAKTEEETLNPSEYSVEGDHDHDNTSPPRPPKTTAPTSSCFECKGKDGVKKCRRGDLCRSNDDGASNDDVMKWCTSCVASGEGFMCPVCKKYQCPKCEKKNKKLDLPTIDISQAVDIFRGRRVMIRDDNDDKSDESSKSDKNSSVASNNSWHPEADLTLRKKKCQHCQRTVCQYFDTSCYNSCDECGEASCKECIKQLGEKWLQCESCSENFYTNASAYTEGSSCTTVQVASTRVQGVNGTTARDVASLTIT